jgi:beta-lactamase class A
MASTLEGLAAEFDARLRVIAARVPNATIGVAAYDYLSGSSWSFNGDRWFHAASVIKVPIMVAFFEAIDQGRFGLNSRLHVRNRFLSVVDGLPFRVNSERDANTDVHAALGRTMRLRELVHHMIVTSSNLATNLLLDLISVNQARLALHNHGIVGVDLCRGVEDDLAFERGINNRVTPDGAVSVMRAIVAPKSLSPESSTRMLKILLDQQFSGTIAPGLPEPIRPVARVAHKTGEISTVSHDVGAVLLPGRPPYVIAILAESTGDARERLDAGIAASTAVYDCIAAAGEGLLQ